MHKYFLNVLQCGRDTESERHLKKQIFFIASVYFHSCIYKMFVYVFIQYRQNQEEILMDLVLRSCCRVGS